MAPPFMQSHVVSSAFVTICKWDYSGFFLSHPVPRFTILAHD